MNHWPSWTGFIRSKKGKKRWQWYGLALKYYNIERGDKNFKVLLNCLQVCPYIIKYKTIWPWFSLKLNCHHLVEGFGETDTLGFLLIIPLGRWLQTGNFCNGANVKISRELNNYLVSFWDCRELFFSAWKPSLSLISWQTPIYHGSQLKDMNHYIICLPFSPLCYVNSNGHFCTLCVVHIKAEDGCWMLWQHSSPPPSLPNSNSCQILFRDS